MWQGLNVHAWRCIDCHRSWLVFGPTVSLDPACRLCAGIDLITRALRPRPPEDPA